MAVKATMDNSPQIFKLNKWKHERSNCEQTSIFFDKDFFSNSVAYVFLIMFKWCNICEFDYAAAYPFSCECRQDYPLVLLDSAHTLF